MSAMYECVKAAFAAHFPDWDTLGWWAIGILIGCVVAGIIGALGGPFGVAAVIAGCLIVLGLTLVGTALLSLAQAIWDCI